MTALDSYGASFDSAAVNRVELRRLSLTTGEGDVNVVQLRADLERAWVKPEGEALPSGGQCVPTALVVQRLWGGEILAIRPGQLGLTLRIADEVLHLPAPGGAHVWNRLDDGRALDFTGDQFGLWKPSGEAETQTPEQLLAHPEAVLQFETLWRRLCAIWAEREPAGSIDEPPVLHEQRAIGQWL